MHLAQKTVPLLDLLPFVAPFRAISKPHSFINFLACGRLFIANIILSVNFTAVFAAKKHPASPLSGHKKITSHRCD